MGLRSVLTLCLLAALSFGQGMRLTVGQLKQFLRSSIQLKQPDKQVADYLKNVTLSEQFTARDLDEMQALGIGPRTSEALQEMIRTTANLTPAPQDPVVAKAAPPPPMPPPSSIEQAKVIEEAREVALNYTKGLPDFICTQVTRRYVDPSGLEMFHMVDRVIERLSYFEQKEKYKLISVNGNLTNIDRDKLGGATSSGEFGSMLREIFEPSTETEFHWERWAKLRGTLVHVYSYKVRQSRSQWHVSWQRQMEVVPGYKGLIYIDKTSPIVLRVTLEAENLPPSFPIQVATTRLDYDFTSIANNQFLLPLRSEMQMREGKILVKNEVEFRNYRKFGAESSITFDTSEDAVPEEKPAEKPPKQ